MVFILEALQADFGDSLLLHYGTKTNPKLIVIDGGPKGVYQKSLRKRLEQLRAKAPDKQLTLEMVMVSHIDRDHITGILDMTEELIEKQDGGEQMPYDVLRFWHNSFDDFVDDKKSAPLSAAVASILKGASPAAPKSFPAQVGNIAVVADVKQGRDLRNNAEKLNFNVNTPFTDLVIAPPTGKKDVSLGSGLTFTVVAPNQQRIDELQDEWNEKLKKLKLAKTAKDAEAIVAAFLDKSIPNLSSIVVLAKCEGKTMLLTGDARGDDLLAGLRSSGLMKKDRLHVDLLKLPHHGSDRNVSTDFFRMVTADHYVVSADGTHTNPDIPTLQMISEARGKDSFTIWLTNKEPRLEKFFAAEKKSGKKYKVVFRKDSQLSVSVALAG